MSFAFTPSSPITDGQPVPASWFNFVRAALPDTIDTVAGGEYATAAGETIHFAAGGGDWVMDAPFEFSDGFIPASGVLDVDGTIATHTGGIIYIGGSSDLIINGRGTVDPSGVFTIQGSLEVGGTTGPRTLTIGTTAGSGGIHIDGAKAGFAYMDGGADFTLSDVGTSIVLEDDTKIIVGGSSGHSAMVEVDNWGHIELKSGASLIQKSGSAAQFDAGSTLTLEGIVHCDATQPAATASPGANRLHSTGLCKFWASIVTDGAGGVALSDADSGYNAKISTTAIAGSAGQYIDVTFVTNMVGEYAINITIGDTTGAVWTPGVVSQTASGFRLTAKSATVSPAYVDFVANTPLTVMIHVDGRQ